MPEALNVLDLSNYFMNAGGLVIGSQTKPRIPPKIWYDGEQVLAGTELIILKIFTLEQK